jgi:hypothetical protein
MKTERDKFREFCEFVMAVIDEPPLPNEPPALSEMRNDVEAQLKNAKSLFVMFQVMDNSVCYSIAQATEEMKAMYERQQMEKATGRSALQ